MKKYYSTELKKVFDTEEELEKAEQTIQAFPSQQDANINDVIDNYLTNADCIIKWIENAL